MSVTPRQLVRFLDRRGTPSIRLAFIPMTLAGYLPASTTEVWIAVEYARKILTEKHRLSYGEFNLIQKAIDFGYCFRPSDNRLEFIYVADQTGRRYVLVLKSARFGQEIWVVTFHRILEPQVRSKLRRNRDALLRTHLWNEEGRRLPCHRPPKPCVGGLQSRSP